MRTHRHLTRPAASRPAQRSSARDLFFGRPSGLGRGVEGQEKRMRALVDHALVRQLYEVRPRRRRRLRGRHPVVHAAAAHPGVRGAARSRRASSRRRSRSRRTGSATGTGPSARTAAPAASRRPSSSSPSACSAWPSRSAASRSRTTCSSWTRCWPTTSRRTSSAWSSAPAIRFLLYRHWVYHPARQHRVPDTRVRRDVARRLTRPVVRAVLRADGQTRRRRVRAR